MRDYSVDSRAAVIRWLSAGAAAAVIMGITYPDLYAAIGSASALLRSRQRFAICVGGTRGRQYADPAARRAVGSAGGRPRRRVPWGIQEKTVHPRNAIRSSSSRGRIWPQPAD